MSGNKLLVDTNVVLYLLSGDKTVADLLDKKQIYLSFISELELLGYPGITSTEIQKVENFLDQCKIVDINEDIKTEAVRLKRKNRIKLPDAIIAATSVYLDMPLFTADEGFGGIEGINLILYDVSENE